MYWVLFYSILILTMRFVVILPICAPYPMIKISDFEADIFVEEGDSNGLSEGDSTFC
jgi:hypothetical protein